MRVHSITTHAVDIVLASLLLLGSVTGAQLGVRLAMQIPAERLRMVLAALVLIIAIRMALGLTYRPEALFIVTPL